MDQNHLHHLKKGGNHSGDIGNTLGDVIKARGVDEQNLSSANDEPVRKLDFSGARLQTRSNAKAGIASQVDKLGTEDQVHGQGGSL